ncbi:hypothetical protein AVEN_245736-1 [Araneus ventricosus]|uniref:GCVT N-terminal domain-containing protein n=1 Tax=Araneus ventricosus TaxID=182803 RepID=A0A4Y2RG99_ARAVE|nr:hypothetical protein AVEN_245736-1 [Araneus ventricosus]
MQPPFLDISTREREYTRKNRQGLSERIFKDGAWMRGVLIDWDRLGARTELKLRILLHSEIVYDNFIAAMKQWVISGSSKLEDYIALHLAAKYGNVKVLIALISAISRRYASKKTGLAALHVAASYDQEDFVGEMLIQVPATIPSERPTDSSETDGAADRGTSKEMVEDSGLQNLLLHKVHVENGAQFTSFRGFKMPWIYAGKPLANEVFFARKEASVFDASYRPQIYLSGKNISKIMEAMVTSDLQEMKPDEAVLTLITNPQGGIINDLVVKKLNENELHIVVNIPKVMKEIKYGFTPLHMAAKYGREYVVRMLLNSAAVQVDSSTAVEFGGSFDGGSKQFKTSELQYRSDPVRGILIKKIKSKPHKKNVRNLIK